MWSYYGRKTKVVKHYPRPKYGLIIEPFAGTAVYSLYEDNWKNEVILADKYDVITKIWNYLKQAKEEDILRLPVLKKGERVPEYLAEEEKYLIGFCINRGSSIPKKAASSYNSWERYKEVIASNLHKIRHWQILNCDYRELENKEATWFIDPPYAHGGSYYKHNSKSINYEELAEWCKSRKGQVIVCENTKADWLPFKPLADMRGTKFTTTEAVWYKE